MKEPPTETTVAVRALFDAVVELLEESRNAECLLYKQKHVDYLKVPFLVKLGKNYISLHAAQTWTLYWCCNGMSILSSLENSICDAGREWLSRVEHPQGGFGGGPGQDSHVALTYAGVAASVYCKYAVDINMMYSFLMSVKQTDGSFRMQADGETDVRGSYCAITAAHLCGVLTPDVAEGVLDYVASCQRPDGGFAGEPGGEAHAGYTYCALATAILLDNWSQLDMYRLWDWLIIRQQCIIGGCNGRPNKLADTCYSFYVGASILMASYALNTLAFLDAKSLKDYILKCCQPCFQTWDAEACKIGEASHCGGLCPQPGCRVDWYHTCYGLGGLALTDGKLGLARLSPLLNITIDVWTEYRENMELLRPGSQFAAGEQKFHEWYSSSTGDW